MPANGARTMVSAWAFCASVTRARAACSDWNCCAAPFFADSYLLPRRFHLRAALLELRL